MGSRWLGDGGAGDRHRSPAQVRAPIDELSEDSVTEVVYQPAGPDTRRELEHMISALR